MPASVRAYPEGPTTGYEVFLTGSGFLEGVAVIVTVMWTKQLGLNCGCKGIDTGRFHFARENHKNLLRDYVADMHLNSNNK